MTIYKHFIWVSAQGLPGIIPKGGVPDRNFQAVEMARKGEIGAEALLAFECLAACGATLERELELAG